MQECSVRFVMDYFQPSTARDVKPKKREGRIITNQPCAPATTNLGWGLRCGDWMKTVHGACSIH